MSEQLSLGFTRNMIVVPEFYLDSFALHSTFLEKVVMNSLDLIIYHKTKGQTMYLPHDMLDSGAVQTTKHMNYQEGSYHNVAFDFRPDATVIDEWDMKLLQRFHYTWYYELRDFLQSTKFKEMNRENNANRKRKDVFPVKEKEFAVFKRSLNDIKCVILGQDPYPTSLANGIAFAIDDANIDMDKRPYALRTVEKALKKDFNSPNDLPSTLANWSNQGVFLLNTALTVEKGNPGSHLDLWKPFIKVVLDILAKQSEPIVWILFGEKAQAYEKYVPKNHYLLKAEHPSASYHNGTEWNHEDVFRRANKFYEEGFRKDIKWI